MLQRLIAAVLGVLGLASIGLGVASATLWRPDDTLVVTAAAPESGTLVVTAPGVLELGGSPVTVTARATGGTKVVLALGREADVAGWVGTDAHTVVTGLADRHALTTEAIAAEPEPEPAASPDATAPADAAAEAEPAAAPAPDPDGSDMWVQQAAGATTAELTWTPQAGRWTLLAAGVGDSAAAPNVVLSWPQTVTTPWLVPAVAAGTLLLLISLALGVRLWLQARRGDGASWHPVATGATPAVPVGAVPVSAVPEGAAGDHVSADDAPTVILTRRQLRAAAAAAPAPRNPARLTLHWRGQGDGAEQATASPAPVIAAPAPTVPAVPASAPTASAPTASAPTASAPTASAPTAPAPTAPAPTAPAPRPAAAPAEPATRSKFGRSGWTPRRPGRPAATESAATTTVSPASTEHASVGTAASASPIDAPSASIAQPAAPGSRADAWRKAWGFPGEADPGSGVAPTPDPPPSPSSEDVRLPESSFPEAGKAPGSGAARRGKDS